MKILLLGATGMAGTAIKTELIKRGIEVVGVSRSGSELSCDITDENQIARVLCSGQFNALINAAAQVDVNKCELDPLESWKINAKFVSILANFSYELDIPLLQISTDHFYTYGDNNPHKETDPVFCVNEYARHKYAAEIFALASPSSLVLRTSILGVRKNGQQSLIEWAINSLLQQDKIELFCDAWTSSLDVDTFAKYAIKLFLDENELRPASICLNFVKRENVIINNLSFNEKMKHNEDSLFVYSLYCHIKKFVVLEINMNARLAQLIS